MKFIITVDTEADNQWANKGKLSLDNIQKLPSFQELCEKFGFKPTYLLTYEVADSAIAVQIIKPWPDNKLAEVGAHLHSWTTPPYPQDKNQYIFSTELDDEILDKQIENLTRKITENFGKRPLSFRAGRFGLDKRTVSFLLKHGYLVDCSVTPKVNWKNIIIKGNPSQAPDFSNFPLKPYIISKEDISQSGQQGLLEIPLTILYTNDYLRNCILLDIMINNSPQVLSAKIQSLRGLKWLRIFPKTKLGDLQKVYNTALKQDLPVIEFMIHSSELLPGGSPYSKTKDRVEHIFELLTGLFQYLKDQGVEGVSLSEFRNFYLKNYE